MLSDADDMSSNSKFVSHHGKEELGAVFAARGCRLDKEGGVSDQLVVVIDSEEGQRAAKKELDRAIVSRQDLLDFAAAHTAAQVFAFDEVLDCNQPRGSSRKQSKRATTRSVSGNSRDRESLSKSKGRTETGHGSGHPAFLGLARMKLQETLDSATAQATSYAEPLEH